VLFHFFALLYFFLQVISCGGPFRIRTSAFSAFFSGLPMDPRSASGKKSASHICALFEQLQLEVIEEILRKLKGLAL
jgi:hypothetical protein